MRATSSLRSTLLLALGAAALACGSGEDKVGATLPMSGFVDDLDATVSALGVRAETHHTSINASQTLTAIHHAEAIYKVDVTVMHNEFHTASHNLLTCSEVLPTLDLGPLNDAIGALQGEIDGHAANSLGAADVPAAQTEEARYEGTIAEVLTALEAARDTLATQAAGVLCPYVYVEKVPHDHSTH